MKEALTFDNSKKLSDEEQFEKNETLKLSGKKIDVVDIVPENTKTDTPVLVAPGWSATPEVFKDNILTLAKQGRRVLAIKAPHGINPESKIDSNKEFPEAELRKVAAIIKTIEEKGIDQIDAIGHSEAGLYLSMAAKLYPEKFRNIVFVNPVGMIGKDNIFRLVKDFTNDVAYQQVKNNITNLKALKQILKSYTEGTKTVPTNPIRSAKEVLAIANTQIHEILKELKDLGIGISIVHTVDDKAFPMDRVQDTATTEMVDGFISAKGTHGQILLEPEKYTKAVDSLLDAMENKINKKN